MGKGRLTRQELGWLLTQEAQGAAERLRSGVQILKTQAPPPPTEPGEGAPLGIDATLDALDDAMRVLSSIHHKPVAARGRRGRIDIAALLWEVAPDARVSIEPGSGTEVYGDEAELRRMLHVMVDHAGGGAGTSVTVKRDGEEVKVGVALGPDSSASPGAERAYISRMAIRYGGRYELEGSTEVLFLPADVGQRDEREALRRELDEAKKQGELYARELVQVLSHGDEFPSTVPPSESALPSAERFAVLSRFAGGVAGELRAILASAVRHIQSHKVASEDEEPEAIRRALLRAHEFVAGLARVGELEPQDLAQVVDLPAVIDRTIGLLASKAERGHVTIHVASPETGATVLASLRAMNVMLREVIEQAIQASPRGGEVEISVTSDGGAVRIFVDDAGPPVPAPARRGFLALALEPSTYGRPSSVALYLAAEIALLVGARLELGDAARGGLRVALLFPRGAGD